MQTETDSHPESVNNRLADFLDARKEAIYGEWLQRIRHDPPLPEHAFNGSTISKRLPSLLDDLSATLRRSRSAQAADTAPENACCVDSDGRPSVDYALCEMLHEIKHLRVNLLYHLRTFEDLHPDYGMAAMLFVSTIVHRFLDDMMIEVARDYRKG